MTWVTFMIFTCFFAIDTFKLFLVLLFTNWTLFWLVFFWHAIPAALYIITLSMIVTKLVTLCAALYIHSIHYTMRWEPQEYLVLGHIWYLDRKLLDIHSPICPFLSPDWSPTPAQIPNDINSGVNQFATESNYYENVTDDHQCILEEGKIGRVWKKWL